MTAVGSQLECLTQPQPSESGPRCSWQPLLPKETSEVPARRTECLMTNLSIPLVASMPPRFDAASHRCRLASPGTDSQSVETCTGWLLSCSETVSALISAPWKLLFKHLFHLFPVWQADQPHPNFVRTSAAGLLLRFQHNIGTAS